MFVKGFVSRGNGSDELLIGVAIPWDSLIYCWKIGNGGFEHMMEVITFVQDKKVGNSTSWWPEHSSGSYSIQIKGYFIDVAVSCVLRDVHSARLYVMGVTAVAGTRVSVATLTHLGGGRMECTGWLPMVTQWAGRMAPLMSVWLCTVVFFWSGEKMYICLVHTWWM